MDAVIERRVIGYTYRVCWTNRSGLLTLNFEVKYPERKPQVL